MVSAIGGNNQAIQTLMKSPTGRKLLEEAQKKGVKINFAQNNGDNVMGQFNPNSNTITVENNSPEKMVETLAHELVHATTRENGNSMNEEKSAFMIGEQVAQEAGVNATPHDAAFWSNHVDNAYKGQKLAQDNGIANALGAMGINTNGGANAGNVAAAQDPYAANTPATANNANVDYNNPFAALDQATQNAADPTQANPLANPLGQQQGGMQQVMQMLMQMLQMIMQMLMQLGGQGNQQQNPLANPLTANNNPLGNANQQQYKQQSFQIMTFQSLA